MQVSGINCNTPFRANVEHPSSLISGNWAYLENPNTKQNPSVQPKKKGKLWKKVLIAAAVVVVAGFALAKARGLDSIKAVMDKGFKDNEGFMNKTKWVIGKLGDWSIAAYNHTIGKVVKMFKGGADDVAGAAERNVEDAASRAGETAAGAAAQSAEIASEAAVQAVSTAGEAANQAIVAGADAAEGLGIKVVS